MEAKNDGWDWAGIGALLTGAGAFFAAILPAIKRWRRDRKPRIREDGPPRVLVVDDDKAVLTLLCETLTTEGFEVECFTSPTKALAEIRRQSPDVALVDLQMPELNGIVFIREALAIAPLTCYGLITGYDSHYAAVQANEAGADFYLTKPLKLGSLTSMLGVAVKLSRARRTKE